MHIAAAIKPQQGQARRIEAYCVGVESTQAATAAGNSATVVDASAAMTWITGKAATRVQRVAPWGVSPGPGEGGARIMGMAGAPMWTIPGLREEPMAGDDSAPRVAPAPTTVPGRTTDCRPRSACMCSRVSTTV